jgi:isopentenyl-diphosphate delta-isomerase type 1
LGADEELEILDVVDADDRVIGARERGDIHRKRLFHRSVHVFVFDSAGRLYLQRRSLAKEEHPGRWDSSASGHVDSGESYEAAAVRELEEEIGLKAAPEPLVKIRACEDTGMEHSMLFRVQGRGTDPSPQPNPQEVLEGRFFRIEEIEERLSREAETFSPSFRLLFRLYREQSGRDSG